jgi:transcriptional regulator with XRE-family HTH domain
MLNEEGKRFGMFIERVLKISQLKFAEEIGVDQTKVNKYIKGKLLIPSSLLKAMHQKYRYSYNWHFDGTGPMQEDKANKKNLMSNVGDIMASVDHCEKTIDNLRRIINQLAADFYASKHNVKA